MSIKRLLILGARDELVPIIRKEKQLRCFVIVASPSKDDVGRTIADKVLDADLKDKEFLLELARNERIDGVITDQFDITVPVVAYIAEQLGLPGIGHKCANYYTNKVLMREICRELRLPVPRHARISNASEGLLAAKKIGFPIVLKPADSSGSKGVFKVFNELEFAEFFPITMQMCLNKIAIVEKYIDGEQYLSRGYVQDEEPRLFAFANRHYFHPAVAKV